MALDKIKMLRFICIRKCSSHQKVNRSMHFICIKCCRFKASFVFDRTLFHRKLDHITAHHKNMHNNNKKNAAFQLERQRAAFTIKVCVIGIKISMRFK